jgi:hypothetical protein
VNLDKREMMDFVDVENGDFPREREREDFRHRLVLERDVFVCSVIMV